MNKNLMFSTGQGEWETPQDLFDQLNKQFRFTLDAAATSQNTKCKRYLKDAFDGDWVGRVFCNPPYGRTLIRKFLARGLEEFHKGHAKCIVYLLPARTDTAWFHEYIYHNPYAEYRFLRGRLKFTLKGQELHPAPYPSMLVHIRIPI